MNRTLFRALATVGAVTAYATVVAQPSWEICIDPFNTQPYSIAPPFASAHLQNELAQATIGFQGTVTYGSATGPCFAPATTVNTRGRIGFGSGNTGSIQSSFDDSMVYTFGMPVSPAGPWSYANIKSNTGIGTPVVSDLYGATPYSLAFSGASDRYVYTESTQNGIKTQCRIDVVGDATRVQWTLTNLNAAATSMGLWYGAWCAMIGDGGNAIQGFGSNDYIYIPGRKPAVVENRIIRKRDPANFPPFVAFAFDQENAYGLRIDTGASAATSDKNGNNSDSTTADEIVVGSAGSLLGSEGTANDVTSMPDFIFDQDGDGIGDVFFNDPAFIIKYEANTGQLLAQNQTRQINQYYRSTWGNPMYGSGKTVGGNQRAYTTVADAPAVLAQDEDGSGMNGYKKNPFTIRVWVDNVRSYSSINEEFSMDDVQITLDLGAGLSLVPGDVNVKTITKIAPRAMKFVDFQVQADGIEVGDLPYTATIVSPITDQNRNPVIIKGTVRASLTKKYRFEPRANLITSPWILTDSSWEHMFGWTIPADFTAYNWDAKQGAYVPSTSAQRAVGTWIIMNSNTHPTEEIRPVIGAKTPTDMTTGDINITMYSGWNLIGNPYPYAIPLLQLVGVPKANPSQTYPWARLVQAQYVSGAIAYWDPFINSYKFTSGINAVLQPGQGYWVRVLTNQGLTMNFPPVTDLFVPASQGVGGLALSRTAGNEYPQTPNHFRLNLRATSSFGSDQENYVGMVATSAEAGALQIYKPPMGPAQDVNLEIAGVANGQPSRFAQSIVAGASQASWKVYVTSKKGGNVNITWPNVKAVPANVKMTITDDLTRRTIDTRFTNNFVFAATKNVQRVFTATLVKTGNSVVVFGGATSVPGSLGSKTAASVRYQLASDALVSLRVLDSNNSEVVSLLSNSPATLGLNTALWDMRRTNGTLVATGNYQFEITAVVDGLTTRKLVPVTVNR